MTFAEMVKAKRSEKGLSLREAAEKSGVGHATISRIENGYPPDIHSFKRLCKWGRFNARAALKAIQSDDQEAK